MKGKKVEITEETREVVRRSSMIGLIWDQIAAITGINKRTLQRHCSDDFDSAPAILESQLSGKLMDLAMSGHPASLMFLLKTKFRWRETSRNEISGPDGAPIQTEGSTTHKAELTPEVAAAISKALEKQF